MRNWASGVFAAAIVAIGPAAATEPTPLFAADSVLDVRLSGPINEIVREAGHSTAQHEAELRLEGGDAESHSIMLSARGNSRRREEVCDFPPLRIEFAEKPGDASLFDGQKRLKLVTHCRRSERFQQHYLLEYAAYQLFNLVTPVSLRARMARVNYVDAHSGKPVTARYGFFIEDTDDAAKRNSMKELDVPDISVGQLDAGAAGRYAIFQYMIGNLDWSMHSGPDGKDCCHNTKLVAPDDETDFGLSPVPYDFDYSGLVDAPYAIPPDGLRVSSVRKRLYRGFCAHNAEAIAAAEAIRAQKDALIAVIDETPGLDERTRKNAVKYLEDFFEDIADNETIEKKVLRRCRG